MTRFRDFFRDDLVKLADTISEFHAQRRFKITIVDNPNVQRSLAGRTVVRLRDGDLERVDRVPAAASFPFEEVPE